MFENIPKKAGEAVSYVQEIIARAMNSVKGTCEAQKTERASYEGKENPEELLDLVKAYGGLIEMADAGVYISQIKKDPQNATAPSYLAEVFKQFPIVEERFKKFIDKNQG
ncbi:MAG: hypothetical protein KBC22_01395 [Candidatus Pacebacteria bacterium]|nr:hypothetical protein [Candidatus Paceibacterota bacterium]